MEPSMHDRNSLRGAQLKASGWETPSDCHGLNGERALDMKHLITEIILRSCLGIHFALPADLAEMTALWQASSQNGTPLSPLCTLALVCRKEKAG